MGIQHGQPRRVEELSQIGDAGHQGVANSRAKRQALKGDNCDLLLCPVGCHAGECRQRQPRQLFHEQPCACSPLPALRSPPQRPVVQQQQDKGQGHQHRLGRQAQGKEGRHQQVTEQRKTPPRISHIGSQRQHEEKSAEHVLPLADPGHRFDVQRMHREDGCREGGGPHACRHFHQHQKQDRGTDRVQHDIDHVHLGGELGKLQRAFNRPQLVGVGHQREPSQRVPIRGMTLAEGPNDSRAGQTGFHVPVLVDVKIVVEVDEAVTGSLAKDGDHRQQQKATDGQHAGAVADLRCGAPSRATCRLGKGR